MQVPARYQFLLKDPGATRLVMEALELLGIIEGGGTTNNPIIIRWADEVADKIDTAYTNWAADWYNKDSIPWCGLFLAICAVRANWAAYVPKNYLSALAWAAFGNAVQWVGREGQRLHEIKVGDIGVLTRAGGGHVGIIIGVTKDRKNVVMIGGNQDNRVSIAQFPIARLYAVRRPPYKVRPLGARHVLLSPTGVTKSEQ